MLLTLEFRSRRSCISRDRPVCTFQAPGQLQDERAATMHRTGLNQPDKAERICGAMQQRGCAGRSAEVEIPGAAAHVESRTAKPCRTGRVRARAASPRSCVRELPALPEPQAPADAQGLPAALRAAAPAALRAAQPLLLAGHGVRATAWRGCWNGGCGSCMHCRTPAWGRAGRVSGRAGPGPRREARSRREAGEKPEARREAPVRAPSRSRTDSEQLLWSNKKRPVFLTGSSLKKLAKRKRLSLNHILESFNHYLDTKMKLMLRLLGISSSANPRT